MRKSSGFTLLEVLVAMTITAMALGSLYTVIAGNKRLAWRAEAALARSVAARSHINYAQLTDEQGDVIVDFRDDKLNLASGDKLDEPKRKTWATASDLRSYQLKDENGELIAQGSYWIKQQLPVGANGGQTGQGAGQGGGAASFGPGGPQQPGRNGGPPGGNGGFPGANGGQPGGGGFPGRNGGRGGGNGGQGGNGGRFPGGQFPGGNGGQFPGGNGGSNPPNGGAQPPQPPGGRR